MPGVGEDERIVRAGIEFARDDLLDVPLRFLKRAENLRRAAQRIRVLNFRARIHGLGHACPIDDRQCAGRNPGCVRSESLMRCATSDCPRKPRAFCACWQSDLRFAAEHLKQTGREQFHPAQQAIRLVRRERRKPGHHGSAVDERETFLALQHDGREADPLQRFRGRQAFAVQARVPGADEQPRHVRQRHEIAARADRTFAGNFRQHAAIQRREQQLNQFARECPSNRGPARSRA